MDTAPAASRAGAPLPPGSLGLPWIGETLPFVRDPFAFLAERREKHGPVFKTRLLGEPVICLMGPDAVSFFYDTRYFTRVDASLFAGVGPGSSDHAAFAAFARMSAGFLALPVKLPFTRYGRALKGRDELRAYLHERITGTPGTAGAAHVLGRLRAARAQGGEAMGQRNSRSRHCTCFSARSL